MKRIALLLLAISACKTSDSSPAKAEPPAPTDRAAPSAPRPAPSLPSDPNAQALGSDHPTMPDRPYGRHHDRMAKLDTDGDGVISDQERAAAMKQRAETLRTKLDTNGDGKLTPDELAATKGRMHFDDPAALDINKDGDISVDELAAAMKARRDTMRDQWQNGGGAGSN